MADVIPLVSADNYTKRRQEITSTSLTDTAEHRNRSNEDFRNRFGVTEKKHGETYLRSINGNAQSPPHDASPNATSHQLHRSAAPVPAPGSRSAPVPSPDSWPAPARHARQLVSSAPSRSASRTAPDRHNRQLVTPSRHSRQLVSYSPPCQLVSSIPPHPAAGCASPPHSVRWSASVRSARPSSAPSRRAGPVGQLQSTS